MRYLAGDAASQTVQELRLYVAMELRRLAGIYNGELDELLHRVEALEVPPASASMRRTVPGAFPNIGAAWQRLDIFDADALFPVGIETNFGAGTMKFLASGRYQFALNFGFEHDESQAGRETQIRVVSLPSNAQAGEIAVIGIGRNTTATNMSFSALLEVGAGTEIAFEIGNGNTITNVVINAATWYTIGIAA